MKSYIVLNANAIHIPLADKTVQCIVTSPPYYGLRDYGVEGQIGLEQSPEEYVAQLVNVFRECWRVLRDDGTLWINLGDSYAGSGVGWGQNKNTSMSRKWLMENRPGGESGRPPGYISSKKENGLKPKDLIGIPWMVAFALRSDGWYLRQEIIWNKPNPMPESVTDRCTKTHESLFLLSKSSDYYFDAEAIKEDVTGNTHSRGKKLTPPKEKSNSSAGNGHKDWVRYTPGIVETRNKRSVWTVATQPFAGSHYAVYPEKLIEPCILAGSRPGDIVLDPFSGSGTTGRVAIKFGRRYVGLELKFEYIREFTNNRLTTNVMLEGII